MLDEMFTNTLIFTIQTSRIPQAPNPVMLDLPQSLRLKLGMPPVVSPKPALASVHLPNLIDMVPVALTPFP